VENMILTDSVSYIFHLWIICVNVNVLLQCCDAAGKENVSK